MKLTLYRATIFRLAESHLGRVEIEIRLRRTDCDRLLCRSKPGGGPVGGEVGAGVVEDAVVPERELAQCARTR